MSPSPDPQYEETFKTDDEVEDYEGRRYSGRSQGFMDRRERACLERVIRAQNSPQGSTVLDMPCGYGRIAPMLLEIGLQPLWSDISPAMTRRVSRRPEAKAALGQFVGNAGRIPLADNSVEGATCIRLIEHFMQSERRTQTLRELGRVVRRWAVVSFYDGASLHGRTKRLACELRGKQVLVAMQSRESLRAEAAAAGMRVAGFHAPVRYLHAHTFALLVPR